MIPAERFAIACGTEFRTIAHLQYSLPKSDRTSSTINQQRAITPPSPLTRSDRIIS
ncbi:hypothetical protein QHH11_12010 [Aphanizomenon sp. PH219]|nr:hypothetical protein [Aphanizomenon sp. 202]MDK2459852.1 hypothetical protein [Aphanizomenon sp. PH219]